MGNSNRREAKLSDQALKEPQLLQHESLHYC